MFEKITNDNVLLFALKHYDNPQCEGEKEFYDDMKRFKYIKRLLKKYKVDGVIKERLLLNHIIILNNVFGPDAASTLLLFKIEPEHWPQLKSFLVYLNMLPEQELKEIDEKIWKLRIDTLGEELAKVKSVENAKRSPVEDY